MPLSRSGTLAERDFSERQLRQVQEGPSMCGIAAIVSGRPAVAQEAVRAMVAKLHHRGPDDSGVLPLPGCTLGHTRLSIIDRAGGAQPMSDDTGRFHVSFNGEIYNFRELRKELERGGAVFRTRSDTETLLLAFREWGENAVQRLNGQFAFVIWDARERRLFAARDRLGEKPLYFAESSRDELLLASEIKAILASGLVEPRINAQAVGAYLQLNYVPPCATIYANVHTVGPGQTLTWQSGQVRRHTYWSPRLSTIQITADEAVREVRRRIEVAVERQMVADTTVGAFLSGGLDSTTIVALMTRHTSSPVQTFAAGFGELINELPFARVVAGQYQTDHHEQQIQIDVASQLERMADVYDEPFGDSSNIPTFLIAELARRDVKVVLAGDGGDELFGGYAWYPPLLQHDKVSDTAAAYWHTRLAAKTCGLLSTLGLPLGDERDRARERFKAIRDRRAFPDLWERHLAALSSVPHSLHRRLLHGGGYTHELVPGHYQPPGDVHGIDRAVDFDVRCYLPGDILVKVDRAAMAHGLETRSPFLDVELVEFVLSLPAAIRFEGLQSKPLLRRACEDLWPAVVRQRGKQGFGAPLTAWLQQPEVNALRRRVFRQNSPLVELFPALGSVKLQTKRHPQLIWNLVCLGLWLEKHAACLQRRRSAA